MAGFGCFLCDSEFKKVKERTGERPESFYCLSKHHLQFSTTTKKNNFSSTMKQVIILLVVAILTMVAVSSTLAYNYYEDTVPLYEESDEQSEANEAALSFDDYAQVMNGNNNFIQDYNYDISGTVYYSPTGIKFATKALCQSYCTTDMTTLSTCAAAVAGSAPDLYMQDVQICSGVWNAYNSLTMVCTCKITYAGESVNKKKNYNTNVAKASTYYSNLSNNRISITVVVPSGSTCTDTCKTTSVKWGTATTIYESAAISGSSCVCTHKFA